MGQEHSALIDDRTPSQTLKDRSVESVARYIKDGHAKKIVVMVSSKISNSLPSSASELRSNQRLYHLDSLGLASAHLPVFRIFDPQIPVFTQILRASICPIRRLSSTYPFSRTIHCPFTPSPTNSILANIDQPSHTSLSACFQTKAFYSKISPRILTALKGKQGSPPTN